MPATLIHADLFHQGVFRGPAAPAYPKSFDADGDRDGLYLVLQPLILTGAGPVGPLPGTVWRYPHLSDYFAAASPVLGDPNNPAVFVTQTLTGPGWPTADQWRSATVPVLFPPGTRFDIELAITYDGDAAPTIWRYHDAIPDISTDARPLAGDAGLVAAAADWPDIAVQSFIRPQINDFAQLTANQQSQVVDWLIGALAQLRSPPTNPPLTAHQIAIRNQFIIGDPVFGPDAVNPGTDARVAQWRARLTGQPALTHDLYLAFLTPDPESPPGAKTQLRFDPPAFKYAPGQLPPANVLFPDVSGQPVRAGSYHHLLWSGLRDKAAGATDDQERKLAESLARLYGLGERLRWPQASQALSPTRFMVVDTRSGRLPNAIGTNVHSLAGQVFRIGDLRRAVTQVQINQFELNGFDLIWQPTLQATPDGLQDPAKTRVAQSVVDFSTRVTAYAGRTFGATLRQDPTNPKGLVLFQPKLGALLDEPLGQGFELPRNLLDFALPFASTEMPWRASQLVVEHPQRTGLTKDEVLGGDQLLLSGVRTLKGVFRLRVRLVRRPRLGAGQPTGGGSQATYVYDIGIAEPLADAEQVLVHAVFTSPSSRTLELWMPQAGGAAAVVALSGALVRLPGGGPFPQPLLRVVDGPTIDAIDSALAHLPDALKSDRGFAVNLAIRNLAPTDPFNVVPAGVLPAGRTLMGLTTRFTANVGQSADLLATRLEAVFDPLPTDLRDPVLAHFRNFSKLRLATQFATKWTLLTYPDALAPLKTPADGPSVPGGPVPDPVGDPLSAGRTPRAGLPTWSYAILHQFDRELDDGADGQGDTARSPEESRYGFVVRPGAAGQFGGYIEHQYSVRLALAAAPAAAFPVEHPVKNGAELRSELHLPASRGVAETRQTVSLLGYTIDVANQAVSINFDPAYLKQLLSGGWGGGQRDLRDAYRTVYEAFADLKTSLAAGELELRVEGWVFDNSHGGVVDAEAPDFLRTTRPVGRGAAKASAIANFAADLAAAVDSVLGDTYLRFTDKVGALVAGTSVFPVLRPAHFADAAWTWTDAAGAASTPADIIALSQVWRTAIRIGRPASAVVPPSAADGRFLPLALSDELRDQAAWKPAAGTTGYEGLAAAAKGELATRLQPGSDLFERATWMVCRDRLAPASPDALKFEAALQVHFGEAANLLFVPPDRARNIPTVSDLYYVPYGFLPVAKHSDLTDALVTFEFAMWLTQLVQAILDGAAFPALELDHPIAAQDAEAQRQDVEDLVGQDGGIAAQICALVLRVDDPASIDKPQTDALYQKVNGLLTQIDQAGQGPLRAALQARFAARPQDFADLRGLGAILFDPDTESSSLYTLRINKRIREDLTEPMTRGAPRGDEDEFHYTDIVSAGGPRFLIDGLDDVTYDAEFTIEQNRYMQAGAIVPDHQNVGRLGERRVLDANTQLVLRGDAQARTGEDVIEADFDPANVLRRYQPDGPLASWSQDPQPQATPQRQLEVNVVHFNPAWRVKKNNFIQAWQYLLPSRIPPSQPAVLTPQSPAGGATAPDPRVSTVRIGADEDPMQQGLFPPRLAAALTARKSVSVNLGGTGPGAAGLTLDALPAYTVVQTDPHWTQGWQRYDTVLAHHYFLVDADPAATPADIIQDDAILVDTTADDDPPVPPPATVPDNGLQATSLYQWFWYDRMRRTPGAQVDKPAIQPTLSKVVDEIYGAFGVDRATGGVKGRSILSAAAPAPAFGSAATFLPRNGGGVLLQPPGAVAGGDVIGGVVAAEILRVSSDPDPNTVTRYAVRVTTLETPLRRTRVRLRVLRNYRDVDADLHNDIAQAFRMTSPFSDWSERSDRAIRLGPSEFIQMGAKRGWILETAVKMSDWLAIDLSKPAGDPSLRRDFGPVLQSVIRATTIKNPQCRLWGAEAEDGAWLIHGVAHDAGRDAHIILGDRSVERFERVHRQNLVAASGQGPVSWSRAGDLTAALDRKAIVSARFEITFVWADPRGQTVMELTFPMKFAR